MAQGKTIGEIKIGDSAKISNTVTETVINDFAKVKAKDLRSYSDQMRL